MKPKERQINGLFELEWSVQDVTVKNKFRMSLFGGVKGILNAFPQNTAKEMLLKHYKQMVDTIDTYYPGLLLENSLNINVSQSQSQSQIKMLSNEHLQYFISAERYILDLANADEFAHKGELFSYAWNPLDMKHFLLGIEDATRSTKIIEELQKGVPKKVKLVGNARNFFRFYSTCFKKKVARQIDGDGISWDGVTDAMMQHYELKMVSEGEKKKFFRNVVNFAIYHVLPMKLKPKITYGKRNKEGDSEQDVFANTSEDVRSQAVMVPTKVTDMFEKLRENKSVFSSSELYFSCQNEIVERIDARDDRRGNSQDRISMQNSEEEEGNEDEMRAVTPENQKIGTKRKNRGKDNNSKKQRVNNGEGHCSE